MTKPVYEIEREGNEFVLYSHCFDGKKRYIARGIPGFIYQLKLTLQEKMA